MFWSTQMSLTLSQQGKTSAGLWKIWCDRLSLEICCLCTTVATGLVCQRRLVKMMILDMMSALFPVIWISSLVNISFFLIFLNLLFCLCYGSFLIVYFIGFLFSFFFFLFFIIVMTLISDLFVWLWNSWTWSRNGPKWCLGFH